jgi:hypothetical protein
MANESNTVVSEDVFDLVEECFKYDEIQDEVDACGSAAYDEWVFSMKHDPSAHGRALLRRLYDVDSYDFAVAYDAMREAAQ